MGKNVNRRFTVDLDISTENIEKKVKGTVGNLKTILSDLGNASDKMGFFKELADYLSQVDAQIVMFKQKHGDGLFEQIFGGLDANLRKETEKIFGVAKEQLVQLEQLKEKVTAAKTNGASSDELKAIEQEVRAVYEAAGMLDKLDLSGRGKVENRIQKIEDALSNFAQVWNDTNSKISKGFNFSGDDVTSDIDNQIDKINKQLEELDEIKKEIRAVNKEFHKFTKEFKFDGSVEPTIDAVKELIDAYNEAIDKRKDFEKAGDTTSREYYENEMDIARLNLKASDWVENYVNKDADLLKRFKNEKLNGKSLAVLLHRMYDEYNFTLEDAAEPIDETIKNLKKEKRSLEKQKKDLSKGTDVDYTEQINKTVKEINDLKAEIAQKSDAGLLNEEDLKSYIQKIGELSSAFKILSQSAGMPAEKIKEVEATIDTVSTNLNDSFNKILKQKNKNPISAIYEDAALKVKRAVGEIAKLDKEYDAALGTSAKINAFDKNSPSDLQREYIVEAFREYQKNKEAIKNMSMSDVTDKDITLLEKQLQLLKTINQASIDGAGIEDYKKVYGLDGEELKSFNSMLSKKTNQNSMNELLDKLKQGLKERRKSLIAELSKDNEEIAKLIEASGDVWEQFLASEGKKLPQPNNVSTALNKELEQKAAKNVEEQKRFNDLKSQFDAAIKDFTDTGLVDVMGAEQKAYNDVLDGIRNKTINTVEECKGAFAKIANLNYDELIQKNEALKSSKPEQQGPTTGENDGKPDGGVAGQIGEDADDAKNKLAELKRIRDEYMSIIDSLSKKKKAKVNITNKNDTEILKSSLQEMQDSFSIWSSSKNGTEEQLEAYGKLIKAVKNYQSAVDFIQKSGSPRAQNLLQTSEISKATTDANNFLGILDAGQLKKIKKHFETILGSVNKEITDIVGDEVQQATGAASDKIEQTGNVAKETETKVKSLTDVFNEYIATVRKAEDIEWNDSMETAYTQILNNIKDNTFTTVEECVAKFKELANITEVIKSNSDSTGIGVGTGMGTGTGTGSGAGTGSSADTSAEVSQLETLNAKLKDVKGSVDAKTDAFSDEYIVVDGLIEAEKAQLDDLKQSLINVTSAVEAKTQAFEDGYIVADAAIEAEIESLNRLKGLLTEIQGILQTVFSVSGQNFGDIKIEQGKENVNAVSSAIQGIQHTLGQILSVLQGFTGIESDGKNSIKQKEPVVDNDVASSEVTEHLASKLSDLATENTLAKIPGAIEQLANAITSRDKSNEANNANTTQALNNLIGALSANITSLKEVMDGVVVHQKAQKSDTKKAMARIQDPAQFKQISSIAENSIGDLGTDVHIKGLKALANGLIGVEGAFKNVNGEWEGFTVKVNESNDAVDLAINKQSAFAKVMQKLEEEMKKASTDANDRKLSPDATANHAIVTANGYDDEGKEVTVQYKDSQRYTVSLKENIGGLQKEVFQTFDDSIEDFNERTTVTVSNKTAQTIRETNKLIEDNAQKVNNADLLSKYNQEYKKLLYMNDQYRNKSISDNDINLWNQQITLVQNLGNEVANLIKHRQRLEGHAGAASSEKRLQEYQAAANKTFNGLDFGLNDSKKTPEQQAIVNTYDQIIDKIDLLKKTHTVLTDSQVQEIDQLVASLKTQSDAYLDAKKKANEKTPDEQLQDDKNVHLDEIQKYQYSLQGISYVTKELSDKIETLKTKLNSIQEPDALETWKNDLANVKQEVDAAKDAFEKINLGYINSEESKIKGIFNKLTNGQKLGVKDTYEQAIKTLEQYRDQVALGTKVELDSIHQVTKALLEKIEAQKKAQEKTPEEQLKIDKDAQLGEFEKYKNSLQSIAYITPELSKELDELQDRMNSIQSPAELEECQKDLANLQKRVIDAKKIFESINLGYINSEKTKLTGSFNKLTGDQKLIVQDAYENAIRTLKQYAEQVESGKKVELNAIIEVTAALREQMDLYDKANKEARSAAAKTGTYGSTQVMNATAKYNSLVADAKSLNLTDDSDAIKNYTNALQELIRAQNAFRAGENLDSDAGKAKVQAFKDAQTACAKYARELNNVVAVSKKLESEGIGDPYKLVQGEFDLNDASGRQSALKSYIDTLGESVVAVGNFTDGCNKLHYTIKNGDGTFTAMTATINKARTAIVATAGDTENATGKFASFFNELKGKFKSISTYFMASFGIEEVWQQLRQGVQYVREIDSALTELKKVTNETDASYDRFLQSMSKTGSVIGATVSDLTTMAADWARLGYSMEEAGKLAESTAILLNVSEFQDATDASEALISTMQAFQYTADESQHVVDILNEIGNNYAVSSDGLAIALQDSASALMEAGNDLEQSVALVAAANKVLQDPNSVGSALRTISLRLRGTSVEVLEELGEETDGAVESISKMQEKLKALTGVDILTDSGAYKDTYTILKEIAEVWDTMDPMNQAAALELMAGKNRANALAAILGNIEDLKYAYEDALDAEGSAMRENERYLESVQGHIDTFNNSLQTMWMNFLDTDAVKWFVHLGDAVIKLVDKFGVLQTAAAGFLTYLNISSNSKLDLASMLGIHELEESFTKGFSIVGKKGLTGGIVKSFNKLFKKNKKETIEVPISIEPEVEQVDMFSDEYMSSIQLNNKLGELRKAQEELKKLRSTKFKDVQIPDDVLEYKGAPKGYLKNVLIPNKEAEIKAIEKDINDITNAAKNAIQNNFVELQSGQVKIDLDDFIDTESISSADLNDIFANFSANFKNNLDGKLIDFSDFEAAAKQIDGFNDALGQGQTAFLNYLPQLNNADAALQSYLSSLNGGQASLQGFQAFIQQHNAGVKASGVAAKAAAVGHQLLNAALSMGISMLASFAIDLVVKSLDKLIPTVEEAAEAAEDAVEKYKNAQSELKTMDSTISELSDDYKRLALGVDEFGNNINLTTAEYERYNQIVNQIADMFPEMVRGYTDEGNAIIKNKGNVEALTEAYKALKAEANNELLNNADNIMSTYKSTIDGSFWSWDNSTSEKISASQLLEKVLEEQDSFDFKKFNSEYRDKEYDTILSLLGDAGISREKSESNDEYVKRAVSEFPGIVQSIINSWDSVVDSAVSNVKPLVSAYLDTSIGYESLTDAQKSIFESIASSFDSNFFSQFDGDASKMYQTIENMILNLKSSGIDDEYTLILNTKTQFNNNEVTIGDYKKQVQEFIGQIEDLQEQGFLDENSVQYIKMSLGFDLDGNSEYDAYINRAKKILQDDYDNMTSELTLSDLQIIDQLDIPDGTVLTWDQLRQKIAEVKRELNSGTASVQTYSELSTSIESYNEVLSQTSEVVSDNTQVTQEYKDSLTALGISNEELSECFDENNGLIVKNADKLKDLVKKQKDEYKNNVKTAKSQAKLKYYKLSKDLVNTVKSTKNLTNAQRDHIKTILEEMDAVQDTISKYTMLESELLGVTNAYKKLADAQEIDSATDYGSKAEEMVNALANAFNTGELGTAAAEAAFEGLIPDWVVANAQSVDEAMESAYNYMKSGALSNLFDIKYDDDGKLESVQMTLDKVKAFTSALTEADAVFHGTWDEFTLDPAINNLDDFANAIGVTKEVAFAYLTELERYDASNIFGDSATGLLDQLMGEDFDYAMQQASQKYAKAAADMAKEFDKVNPMVDMFNRKILYDDEGYMVTMASESFKASDFGLDEDFAFNVTPILPDGTKLENVEDYIYNHLASGGKLEDMDIFLGSYATLDEAIAKGERLSELQGIYYENQLAIEELENKALDFASAWGKTSDQLTDAREEAESLGRELAGAKNGVNESTGRTVEEIEADIRENDKLISDLLSNLDKLKDEFGGEPTEMIVGVALDEVQEDIDNFKKDLEKKPAELQAAITTIDSTGFENLGLTKNADGSWSGLAELDWYQKLDQASKEEVTNYLNMVESEHYLNLLMGDGVPTIEDHLQTISTVLQDIARMMNPTYTLHADTTAATNNVMTFKSWWNSLGDKVVTLYQRTIGSWFGGNNVNGTANVGGSAYAGGKWGANKTEQSLVGELGPEMIVRGNRWFTVGENGAEFTQVKKGDIIFNHRQTEELLKNGHVTGRGKAYASGTAYAGINTFTPYVPPTVSSGGNSSDSDSDSSDDYDDDSEQVVDFIEMKLEEIEAIIEKTATRIANFLDDTTSIKSKDELYDELVKAEKDKSEAYLAAAQKYNVEAAAALSGVPQKYQEMARNGAIAIKDFIGEDQVEIAEKIQEYRDWAAKADEAENGHLEAIAAISAHRVEQLEDIATDFENIISISQSHSDLLQAEMDFIEESGDRLSENYYEELKKHSQKRLDDMQDERVALQKILDDAVAAGDVIIGSDDWYSMLETIYEVDQEIVDCKTSLEEFQNAINELYWDNLDKLIAEIDAVDSELSNLFDLISDDDKVVDEMGNWTDEGIASLGLLAQQMEVAQQKSKEYGQAIDKLKKDYADGIYSTDEYNEKLAELTDSQYDAIKSYEDAKDAIVDLNKTRAEAVKKYIQEEIDKYGELIEKKKESLNADKEARDFEKSVQESNKNIKDIERKIASLKGNTSSSAMAERKRLEAELLKAREELNDLYYDHSVEKQQEALDKELEDYTKNKEDQMDALDEYLEKEEQVIADSFDLIAENTKNIADVLIGISEEYGVSISDTVATPWINGANAIGTYEEQLNTSVSATTKNLDALKQQLEDLQTQADKTAESIVNATHSTVVETNDGHQTSIKGYAKGSKSVEYDQWALINELGDELQLVPNQHGQLDYIKKGTGILNNTLTERLMDLAMDPTSMIENNRPVIGTPGITTTNNTIEIDASVGTLLHVEHLDGSNPAEVAKLVDKAWEKKMQTLNNSIKKFTR